jgi:hypothetical protein
MPLRFYRPGPRQLSAMAACPPADPRRQLPFEEVLRVSLKRGERLSEADWVTFITVREMAVAMGKSEEWVADLFSVTRNLVQRGAGPSSRARGRPPSHKRIFPAAPTATTFDPRSTLSHFIPSLDEVVMAKDRQIFIMREVILDLEARERRALEEISAMQRSRAGDVPTKWTTKRVREEHPWFDTLGGLYVSCARAFHDILEGDPNADISLEALGHRVRYPTSPHFRYAMTALAGLGGYATSLMHQLIGTPSSQSMKRYRTQFATDMGLVGDICDGSRISLAVIKRAFYGDGPMGITIVSDGTFFKMSWHVPADAQAPQSIGDVTPTRMTQEQIAHARSSPAGFLKEMASRQLARGAIVAILAPAEEKLSAIPALVIPDTSGSASISVRDKLDLLAQHATEVGFEVMGFGHDADRGYYRDLMAWFGLVMDPILNDFAGVLSQNIVALAEHLPALPHFFDMLHIIKNDKTAKIHSTPDQPQYLIPGCAASAFSTANLLMSGVPAHILDTNPYREMDDMSAKLLFNIDVIEQAFNTEDFPLAIALLPAYLTHTSILLPNLNRGQRIQRLSLAFAIIARFCAWMEGLLNGSTAYESNAAWNRELCAKYMTLILALIAELKKKENVNLAAFGSHLIEHFFALVKRLMGMNQTAEDFVRCVRKAVVQQAALTKLNLTLSSKGKESDSGVKVSGDDQTDDDLPLYAYFEQAECFYRLIAPGIPCFTEASNRDALGSLIADLQRDKFFAPRKTWSTSGLRVASTANTSQRVAQSAAMQIETFARRHRE